MRYCTSAIAASLILFSTHAMAAPFNHQASTDISEPRTAKQNTADASLFELTLNFFGFTKVGKPADQEFFLSYRDENAEQCAEKVAIEEEETIEAKEEKLPAGPEPMYFGF